MCPKWRDSSNSIKKGALQESFRICSRLVWRLCLPIFSFFSFWNSLFLLLFKYFFRYVTVQDELPQRPSWSCGLSAAQRANVAHLHPSYGEDWYFLPDGAQPGGSEHHLCGHRPPQPARLADHLPLWVSSLTHFVNFFCLTHMFFFDCCCCHLQTMQNSFFWDCFWPRCSWKFMAWVSGCTFTHPSTASTVGWDCPPWNLTWQFNWNF